MCGVCDGPLSCGVVFPVRLYFLRVYDEYTFVPNGVTDRPPVLCFQVGFWFHRTYLLNVVFRNTGYYGFPHCASVIYVNYVNIASQICVTIFVTQF